VTRPHSLTVAGAVQALAAIVLQPHLFPDSSERETSRTDT